MYPELDLLTIDQFGGEDYPNYPKMLNVFKNSILKVKKESLLSILFILCETGFEIVVPFMMAKLIDLGIESSDMHNVYKFGFILYIEKSNKRC